MICKKCNKKAIEEVEYAGFHYCDNHFLELMEKRVRKNLRTMKLIDIKKKYILYDDSSSESELTEYFLAKIFKGHLSIEKRHIPEHKKFKLNQKDKKISEKNQDKHSEHNQNNQDNHNNQKNSENNNFETNIIYPTNLDEQALQFLNIFLQGGKIIINTSHEIMPLEVLTEQEVEILCGILNIKFRKRTNENILDSLEEKYPGTKFSVFQSRMNLIKKLN
jgi:hypothetical protein